MVTGGTQGPRPFGWTRATGADHHQHVGGASGEHVEDLAEREKRDTHFVQTFAGV